MAVNMTIRKANQLLQANFSTFTQESTNQTVIRTLSFSVPEALQSITAVIHPTTIFPIAVKTEWKSFNKDNTTSSVSQIATERGIPSLDCESTPTPQCFQDLYDIPKTPATQPRSVNSFGVSGFDNQFTNKHTLNRFLTEFRPDMNPNTTYHLFSVDDGINNQLPAGDGFEAEINMQYSVGLATNVPITFISTGTIDNDFLMELLDQAIAILASPNPPKVIVNTYPTLESSIPDEMAKAICNVYAQLGARGISLIHDTNIFGVGIIDNQNNICTTFEPYFPATCPFVTAVGGTDLLNQTEFGSEFSGGGFSNIFPRPRYQEEAVKHYVEALGDTYSGLYNSSGRAIPDLSAFLSGVTFFGLGGSLSLGSTAFSATAFASIIALINDERAAVGKHSLGFLNPLLYANPRAFTDMTVGNNPGCNTNGFNATVGWDPVTGLGTPLYNSIKRLAGL